MAQYEYFDNTTKNGDCNTSVSADEFDMARLRRPYVVSGVQIWLTGENVVSFNVLKNRDTTRASLF